MLFEAFLGLIEAGVLKRDVDGVMLHGAFFLGPKSFYRALREMPPEQLARIQMMPVSFTNELYGNEVAKRRARVDARFVNNAMMATLMGAAVSDGLEDGQVVSGVGGQYNFVAQAFALQGARSGPRAGSDAADGRGHAVQHPLELRPRDHSAAPARYLRHRIRRRRYQGKIRRGCDRGDARRDRFPFSGDLAKIAKDAGKLPRNFEIPAAHRENFPDRIATALKPAREAGLLPSFPFGSDFTDVEQRLIPALQVLQEAQRTPLKLPGLLWQGMSQPPDAADRECLARLGLDRPTTWAERAYRALVSAALARSRAS